MSSSKLANFLNGVASVNELINRAGEVGSFLEYVCLSASLIDGLLRTAIILNQQIKNKSQDLIDELLFQEDSDKIVTERQIYLRALKEKIIRKNLFDRLEELYKKRNQCVHRYLISDITYRHVLEIAIEYCDVGPQIVEVVAKLERKQVELGVGMTELVENNEDLSKIIREMAQRKHGKINLGKSKKNL